MLALAATPTHGAEPAAEKTYAFDLVTLQLSARARGGRVPHSDSRMRIEIPSAMTDDEFETVKNILDQLEASPPDAEGYRSFSMPNGTRGRIGGFVEDPEVAGAGVRSLPTEFTVKNEFSTAEAALVLRMAVDANLFVAKPDDPTVVATTYPVTDRPFRKEHPRASVTGDEASLAAWVRQNIPAR